ncbi:SPOR domain-containing protein [Thalassobaculum sp. OXR-137]|uniref:SPOR domain-containing protein n=1 Tax=Thalassobaculum sp. OXR-137 TaxID=3100173 RepID=UPI002AC8C110|nr:SPOR domain-containing protein [Thalassobaculum sp. OXR-137]WPZ32258.1 SPOR domain-containing protein [Thalassobaculum sp. OXR-137]
MAQRRPLLLLAIATVLLSGCSSVGGIGDSLTGTPPADQLPPAPAPIYAAGDTFVYTENGQPTREQVVSVAPDRVVWTNDSGLIWTKDTALVTPQLRWSSHPELGRGQQTIIGSPEQLFPLQEGNVIAYSVRGSAENAPAGWQEEHRCVVSGQEDVQVPAGTYTTFRIDCQRKDFLDSYFYSPVVQNYVLRVRDFGTGQSRKELLSVTLANDRTRDLPATIAGTPNPVEGPTVQQPVTPPVAVMGPTPVPVMAGDSAAKEPVGTEAQRADALISRLEDVVARLEKVAGMDAAQGAAPAAVAAGRSAPRAAASTGGGSSGPWAVHLASYRSQRSAQDGWKVLQRKFPALKDKKLVTSEFDPGNGRGTYVRLMAQGFPNRDAAVQFCAPLKASGQFCDARGPLP